MIFFITSGPDVTAGGHFVTENIINSVNRVPLLIMVISYLRKNTDLK